MIYYPPSIRKAIQSISKLPGIGEKTAERLAMHLLRAPRIDVEQLSRSILELKNSVRLCEQCYGLSDAETCGICSNPARDPQLVCVVEQPADIVPIERTREFRGLYHVLGGALSPIDGVEPGDLHIAELVRRIDAGVHEVILATNPTMTGEATAMYIAEQLPARVRVTRLASGLPVGGDLEYADELTLGRAFAGRRSLRHEEE